MTVRRLGFALTMSVALALVASCTSGPDPTAPPVSSSSNPAAGLAPAVVGEFNPAYPLAAVRTLDLCLGPDDWSRAFDAYNDPSAPAAAAASGEGVSTPVLATVELDPARGAMVGGRPRTLVHLTDVTVLAGPQIDTSTAWVDSRVTPTEGDFVLPHRTMSLWAPDGRAFGWLTPEADGRPSGPNAEFVPVVDDLVILNDCWWDQSTPKYWWHGPLEEVPGTRTIDYFGSTFAAIPLQVLLDASARVRPWSSPG